MMDGVWLGIDSGAWIGFTIVALFIVLCIRAARTERRYPICPRCSAVQWGNAFCPECRSHWPDGDPLKEGRDAQPRKP